jgi:hypothetical protein
VLPLDRARAVVPAVLAAVVALAVVSCDGSGATFSPDGPCVADGRAPGAYPDLEALVPTALDARLPDRLDSGRNCSARNLGTLAEAGIEEIRFAGGLWERGAETGTSLAVFEADGLTAGAMIAFYEAGARAAPDTEDIETADVVVGGRLGRRLDLVNDTYLQSIVAWPSPDGATVEVALVSSSARDIEDPGAHETAVVAAVEAFGEALGG